MSKIIQEINNFRLLLAFSSRLPLTFPKYSEKELGRSMMYYPFVGFVISLLLCLLLYFITSLDIISLSPSLLAIMALILEILLVGAIHLDGLADMCDGIFSYQTKEKMLEIMKDSCLGTNASLALIFYFLTKFALLTEVFTHYTSGTDYWLFIIIPAVFARYCVVYSCAFFPYAKNEGMGKTFVDNIGLKEFFKSTLGLFLLVSIVSLWLEFSFFTILLTLAINLLFAFYFNRIMLKKLGGSTGDTFGALLELSSLLALFILVIITKN